jgi:hypothetical protein
MEKMEKIRKIAYLLYLHYNSIVLYIWSFVLLLLIYFKFVTEHLPLYLSYLFWFVSGLWVGGKFLNFVRKRGSL